MIRHQVYFDTLGSMKEDSASWRSVFAGLSVLRLVDSYTETGASIDPANWAQLHSVRTAIADVSEGDPVRNVWVVQWAMIACLSIIPLALIAGPVRHIPFWWSCIDMSFGVFGLIQLLVLHRIIKQLAVVTPPQDQRDFTEVALSEAS